MAGQKRSRVLLVDDDLDFRCVMEESFRLAGMGVVGASGPGEALSILRSDPTVGVVVMDYLMPEMNGLELVERIRRDAALQLLPVLILSGDGSIRGEAEERGAWFMDKPFEVAEMLARVRSLFTGQAHFRPLAPSP